MDKRTWMSIAGLSLVLAACGKASPQPIRLPMGYIPNVQYAPFYLADGEGYFEEAGLDIEFDYSLETDAVARVGAGETPFGLASGEQVLLARAHGIPVVYVLAWFQDFPVAVASPAGSGIRQPQDLTGKRIGIPGLFGASYIGYRALLRAAGMPEDAAALEAIGFNQVEALLAGQLDGVVVYANNEPIQLEARGMPVDLIRVADYVDLASNGLIANEDTLASDPELVRSMVRAVVRGLEATLADPEAAFAVAGRYVPGLAESGADVQREVLQASLGFWEAERIGWSSPEAWANMEAVLLAMGLLPGPVDAGSAFTNEFVP
ncbi:MAG: ABC transporter substrate-binding protein [Anaerolineales bacterium]